MNGKLITDQSYFAWETNCDLPIGTYTFGADGKMIPKTPDEPDEPIIPDEPVEYDGWTEIEGEMYYYVDGAAVTGIQYVPSQENAQEQKWYKFAEDGVCGPMDDGLYTHTDGNLYYILSGKNQICLQKVGEDYYFFLYNGVAIKDQVYYAFETNCDLPVGNYEFGADGAMLQGIIEKEDGLYYYVDGKAGREYGLLKIGEDYYFALMNGKLITDQSYFAWETNCDLPIGTYTFGADGKMIPEEPEEPVLSGWIEEDEGYAYYIDGEKCYGIQEIEGYYYDFGTAGVNAGQTKLNGFFYNEDAAAYYYADEGLLLKGWNEIESEWYYFNTETGAAASGAVTVAGVAYEFEENGKLVDGVWVEEAEGTRYYYGPAYHTSGWQEIDGSMYYFRNGYRLTGVQTAKNPENAGERLWFDFGEDGAAELMPDGLYTHTDGNLYYLVGGKHQIGLQKVEEDYYFFLYDGTAIKDQVYNAFETYCDLPTGDYEFGPDGKMLQGIVEKEDGSYYYINGVAGREYGLLKIDEDYYFVLMNGKLITDQSYFAWETNCDLPVGTYTFGADGKMIPEEVFE